jgi:hypothetical protein
MSEYDEVEDVDVLAAWSRTHKNDDETHVHVVDVGETYLATAVDLDGEGNVLASETVSTSVTPDEAVERARRWCEKNPKGVKGDGALASLIG